MLYQADRVTVGAFSLSSGMLCTNAILLVFYLTLKVPVTAIDALRHFETG